MLLLFESNVLLTVVCVLQGCALAEPCGPWSLTFVIGRLGNLIFFILKQLHEKFLQFDRLRTVVFQLNLKYLCENYKPFAGSSIKKIIA